MTNEEREALIAQGWTPPVTVDPDWEEAERIRDYWADDIIDEVIDVALAAIKRGRALAAAEAQPGMVWKRYKGYVKPPVSCKAYVCVRYCDMDEYDAGTAEQFDWLTVTHYAIITQPEDAA